jgi:hypothetical protein
LLEAFHACSAHQRTVFCEFPLSAAIPFNLLQNYNCGSHDHSHSKAAALGIMSWAKGLGVVDAALLQDGPV